MNNQSPSVATSPNSKWADFHLATAEITRNDVSPEQQKFGANINPDRLLAAISNTGGNGVSSLQEQAEEKEERRKEEQAARQFAQATSDIISLSQFNDIENFMAQRQDEIQHLIRSNEIRIAQNERTIIEKQTELKTQEGVVTQTETDLQGGMKTVNEIRAEIDILDEKRKSIEEQLKAANESGDTAEIKRLETVLQENKDANKIAMDELFEAENTTSDKLDAKGQAENKLKEIGKEIDKLKDENGNLSAENQKLKTEFDQNSKFIENLKSPEIQEKLKAGTLTREDLEKAGAPQSVLDNLKADTKLDSANVYGAVSTSTNSLNSKTQVAIAEQAQTTQLAQASPNAPQNSIASSAANDGNGISGPTGMNSRFNVAASGVTPERTEITKVAPAMQVAANSSTYAAPAVG